MSEHMPLISVIVPVYNVGEFLIPCLDSLKVQTYRNLEILLIDDGSTDGSGKRCDEYAETDPRFKVIHKENGGVSSARNLGLDLAQGEYISFVDADDYVVSNYIAVLYQDIIDQKVDMVCCNCTIVDEQHNKNLAQSRDVEGAYVKVRKNRLIQETETYFQDMLLGREVYWATIWSALFKSSLVKQLRFERMSHYEDGFFMFELFRLNPTTYLDEFDGYFYVERATSVCRSASKYAFKPKTDRVKLYHHKYFCLKNIDPESIFCREFFKQYAGTLHEMAYAAAQPENKHRRKECDKLMAEHLPEVLSRKNLLPEKLRHRLMLYSKAPHIYYILSRLNELRRG